MSATGRVRNRRRGVGRGTSAWIAHGLLTPDGLELTPAGEHHAEYLAQARMGYWDPPVSDPGPDGFGWSPDPYPGGELR